MMHRAVHYQMQNTSAHTGIDRKYYLNYTFQPHFHDKAELVYVTDGEMNVILDQRTENIPKNHFCLILPWQIHGFTTLKHSRSIILVFPNRLIGSFIRNVDSHHSSSQVFEAEPEILELFMRHLYLGPLPDEYIVSGILLSLCHCFITQCTLLPAFSGQKTALTPDIMRYITTHYREDLNLKQVASSLGYSYYHLSHILNDDLGMSFSQFLNATRINLSLGKLRDTNHSITDIAYACGFSSVRSYNRNFKAIIGLTPTQYRTQLNESLSESDMLRLDSTEFFHSSQNNAFLDPDAPNG